MRSSYLALTSTVICPRDRKPGPGRTRRAGSRRGCHVSVWTPTIARSRTRSACWILRSISTRAAIADRRPWPGFIPWVARPAAWFGCISTALLKPCPGQAQRCWLRGARSASSAGSRGTSSWVRSPSAWSSAVSPPTRIWSWKASRLLRKSSSIQSLGCTSEQSSERPLIAHPMDPARSTLQHRFGVPNCLDMASADLCSPYAFGVKFEDCEAVLFDLDGVLTPTADVHMRAWQSMLSDFLLRRGIAEPYVSSDYFHYIDGKPRYEGVRSFLPSRWRSQRSANRRNRVWAGKPQERGVRRCPGRRRRDPLSGYGGATGSAGRAWHQDGGRFLLAQCAVRARSGWPARTVLGRRGRSGGGRLGAGRQALG